MVRHHPAPGVTPTFSEWVGHVVEKGGICAVIREALQEAGVRLVLN